MVCKGRSRRCRSGGGSGIRTCGLVRSSMFKEKSTGCYRPSHKRRSEGYVAGCLAVLAACSKRDQGCMPASRIQSRSSQFGGPARIFPIHITY